MHKKYLLIISMFAILVVGAGALVLGGEEEPVSVHMDASTTEQSYLLETFEFSKLAIIETFEDGSFKRIPVDASMVPSYDHALNAGRNTISVLYRDHEFTLEIYLSDAPSHPLDQDILDAALALMNSRSLEIEYFRGSTVNLFGETFPGTTTMRRISGDVIKTHRSYAYYEDGNHYALNYVADGVYTKEKVLRFGVSYFHRIHTDQLSSYMFEPSYYGYRLKRDYHETMVRDYQHFIKPGERIVDIVLSLENPVAPSLKLLLASVEEYPRYTRYDMTFRFNNAPIALPHQVRVESSEDTIVRTFYVEDGYSFPVELGPHFPKTLRRIERNHTTYIPGTPVHEPITLTFIYE